jgi:hypothetical protein
LGKSGTLRENWHYALDFDFWQKFMAAGYASHLLSSFIGASRIHPESTGRTMEHIRHSLLDRMYKNTGYLRTRRS